MAELTLVPSTLARTGYRFRYQGDPGDEACDGCPVRSICYRLEAGRTYAVKEVRSVEHPCALHDGDKVRVCTAEPVPSVTTVEARRLRGTAVTWEPVPCGYPECDKYALCHPAGQPAGRYEVMDDLGDEECPMHYKLRRVRVQPIR